jgi:hypothetical protein
MHTYIHLWFSRLNEIQTTNTFCTLLAGYFQTTQILIVKSEREREEKRGKIKTFFFFSQQKNNRKKELLAL